MEKVGEDQGFVYFKGNFQGNEVNIKHCKKTGEIMFNSDDVARCLGFKDMNTFLGSDTGLDAINRWKKEHPGRPYLAKMG